MDNLLTEGKAVPMIVVVPEAHALPPEDIPGTDNRPYLAKNQQAVNDELFHDVIPFIEIRCPGHMGWVFERGESNRPKKEICRPLHHFIPQTDL